MFEQIGIFQKLAYDDAQAIAQMAIDAFLSGQVDRVMLVYNEFRSVMTQRVVVDQLLPIARADVEATGSAVAPIVTARSRAQIDYLYEPSPAGDLQPAAAALHRGAGVSRAARVERGVLRRADDGDGHGVEELRGDDRQPDAAHEQGAAGGDHARDHRGGVRGRGAIGTEAVPVGAAGRHSVETLDDRNHGETARRQDRADHRPGHRRRVRGRPPAGNLQRAAHRVRGAGRARRRST